MRFFLTTPTLHFLSPPLPSLFTPTLPTLLTLLALSALPTPSYALTLNEAVTEAIDTNPKVQSKIFDKESSCALIRKAKGYYLPTGRIFADVGKERADNSSTRAAFGGDTQFTRREGTIELSQVLFDGGFRGANLDQSFSLDRFASWQLKNSKEETAYFAALAYVEVLRNRRIVEIYKDDVQTHEKILEKIVKRFEGGLGMKSEVNLAESRLELARSDLDYAEANLADANSRFEEIIGFAPPEELEIPELPLNLPESKVIAQTTALISSPIIQGAIAVTDAKQAQIDIDAAAFYPTISLVSTTFRGDQLNGVPGPNFFAQGVIAAYWDVFNGGRDIAQMKSDQALYQQSIYDVESSRRTVNDKIDSSLTSYYLEFERYKALTTHTSLSWEVYQNYGKEFELGTRTFFDLLNSQVEFFNAQVSEVNSFYAHRVLGYRVMAAMGKLTDYFILKGDSQNQLCE